MIASFLSRISQVAVLSLFPWVCAAAHSQQPRSDEAQHSPAQEQSELREQMLKQRGPSKTDEEQELDEIRTLLRQLHDKYRQEQQGPPWKLADVTKMAELVVLAHCKETRLLDVDKIADPAVKKLAEDYSDAALELHVATFEVQAVLNGGEEETKTLELLYPLPRKDTVILTHVDFVHLSMRLKVPVGVQVVIEGEVRSYGRSDIYHEITPLYLLFVKKCGETMYEPASTTKWPSRSIRRVVE